MNSNLAAQAIGFALQRYHGEGKMRATLPLALPSFMFCPFPPTSKNEIDHSAAVPQSHPTDRPRRSCVIPPAVRQTTNKHLAVSYRAMNKNKVFARSRPTHVPCQSGRPVGL